MSASSYGDMSDVSVQRNMSYSSASSVSQQMSDCSLQEKNEEERLERAKDFLNDQSVCIVSECDACQILPHLCCELQDRREADKIKKKSTVDTRSSAMEDLVDLVTRLNDWELLRQFFVTIVRLNPSLFLEEHKWNEKPEFKAIVQERIYYLDMLLCDIPSGHSAWKALTKELVLVSSNPLIKCDWSTIAFLNEINERELSEHAVEDADSFWKYWCQSSHQPKLCKLLESLLKIGLLAFVEVLALDEFQLPRQSVKRLIADTPRVPDLRSRQTGQKEPRAGPLPPNSTMLHDEGRRVETFSAIASQLGGKEDLFMRALAFDMDRMRDLREQHRFNSRARKAAMLDEWYKDTMAFEPLVEHLLFACHQAQLGRLADDIESTYPECTGLRSPFKDKRCSGLRRCPKQNDTDGDTACKELPLRCQDAEQGLFYLPFSVLMALCDKLDNEKIGEHDWRLLARHHVHHLSDDDILGIGRRERERSPAKYIISMWAAAGRQRNDLYAFLLSSGMYEEAMVLM
ncbi:uncharacterized protein LOC135809846 isoform X1 [Sycon ciliatum]|uniref:uncharacterized protein LOC135809846 isoform X1 n=1 Tax=Sycon ciliatum TaxID=27933 RepID=UPI0031F706E1